MTQHWPWSREIYALILNRLVDAGAKVVMFDLTFPTSTDSDKRFRLALDRHANQVVIGSNFVDPSWNGLTKVGASLTRPPESLIPQTKPMDEREGYTNFWPDADDVVRRAQYRVTFEQVEGGSPKADSEQFVSLGGRALIKAGFPVPNGLEDRIIRFTAPPRMGFPPHSVFEIFVPDYWKHNYQSGEFFRDKIVVVGAEGNWQHDEHQTPFGSMAGPELQLNAMNAAINGEFISEMSPKTVNALTIFAGVLALCLSLLIRSPWTRLIALLVVDCLSFRMAVYLFDHASLYVPLINPSLELNITILAGFVTDFAAERFEKNRVRRTLENYVSRDVVKKLLENPESYTAALGGVTKPVTVLFSDIRGFSLVTARSEPQVLVTQLNEYFSAMVECVFRFGGTLDKFIGDSVMGVWGNAHSNGSREDAADAVRAALAMRKALVSLNRGWSARGLPQLRIGIGLGHGEVIVGNIGSPQRMEFTVIGDAVNMTWKLQELTRELDYDLLVGPHVHDLVAEYFDMRSLGCFEIKGQARPIEVFGVSGPVQIEADQTRVHTLRA